VSHNPRAVQFKLQRRAISLAKTVLIVIISDIAMP